MTTYVLPLHTLRHTDTGLVGGKNASLGEMLGHLSQAGIKVPDGFATTAEAYQHFLQQGGLGKRIASRLQGLDTQNVSALATAGTDIRSWIMGTPLPPLLVEQIKSAYTEMGVQSAVAVRSSATAEDLPDASFAGQQETFLNIVGVEAVLQATLRIFASLYEDRAIAYRVHQGYADTLVSLCVGVQKMARSDRGSSGVMFTLDTESGFRDVVFITSSYGLGESVVQGAVNPDEFYVHKPLLRTGHPALIRRTLGSKMTRMVLGAQAIAGHSTVTEPVPPSLRNRFSLSDEVILELARQALRIEEHYGRPMDIEWAWDEQEQQIYILQARPETVQSKQKVQAGHLPERQVLKERSTILCQGRAIAKKTGSGRVRVVHDPKDMHKVQKGDVLVADMTDPNWEPVMQRAAAIVTNRGGRTCHAAIIARELGVPAVVGCGDATECLTDGLEVTVSCGEGDTGIVYTGILSTVTVPKEEINLPALPVKMCMIVGNPQLAFEFAQTPNDGVALARLEFIINSMVVAHPRAIVDYPQVPEDLRISMESLTRGYPDPRTFFVQKIMEGVSTIAAAFWPKSVIVRLSDFKSNEYRKLMGGTLYEPEEENPMLGFRGAARYVAPDFAECFRMECEALRRVREELGYKNVEIMVPFVRTLTECKQVIDLLGKHGLERGKEGLRLIMMCEIPSNVILADQFLDYFDGFSIGSNDLTQLCLGVDRDSGLVANNFDERDPAVKSLFRMAITACRRQGKYVGICGQGPSDYPELAQWLKEEGISALGLNPDTVVRTWQRLASLPPVIKG